MVRGMCLAAMAIPAMAVADIKVVVSHGAAPENLLSGKGLDFEHGLAGWTNKRTDGISCVEVEGRGKTLFCTAESGKGARRNATVFRYVQFNPEWKGRTFILSCDIKPSAEVSAKALPDSLSGLGCRVTFWSGDWKKSKSVGCMAEGLGKWQRKSSRPFAFPDWAVRMGVTVGLEYSKGSGFVDDIALEEAISAIDVAVESGSDSPIRQVKVAGDDGRIFFDSGLVRGGVTWRQRIPIGSHRRVKVYAVDAKGDVGVAESVR